VAFILILYMSGYSAGGPAMVRFDDRAACEAARVVIKKEFGNRIEGTVCVPAASAQ